MSQWPGFVKRNPSRPDRQSPLFLRTPTVHPSSVLRVPDGEREPARREFAADLRRVAAYLGRTKAK